ncbi:MAG: lycopene cyclase family protein [Balneolaceae bacterium]|nr:lycopene cyclase family protein [Balneolaceae bacterium]
MSNLPHTYDYIIAGAGSSGLSLAWHMLHSDLRDKQILVVDKDLEPQNDKTWCFWEKNAPVFENVVQKKWDESDIFVNGDHYHEQLIQYPYYSIRSGSYRAAILEELKTQPNITVLEAPIKKLSGSESFAELNTEKETYRAEYIFQSCFKPHLKKRAQYPLIQHFLGWEVSTSDDVFDPSSFILMDFDETYGSGIAFMYVLPWSGNWHCLNTPSFPSSRKN